MSRLSEYAAIATLLGPETFTVVDNPGVAGGTKKITATNAAAQLAALNPTTMRKMGSAKIAADQTGITALADLTGFTVSFTAIVGHIYHVFYTFGTTQVTATGSQTFRVFEQAVDLGIIDTKPGVVATGFNMISGFTEVSGLAAGARILKLRGTTSAGTLTISNAGAVNGRYTVYDVGT